MLPELHHNTPPQDFLKTEKQQLKFLYTKALHLRKSQILWFSGLKHDKHVKGFTLATASFH